MCTAATRFFGIFLSSLILPLCVTAQVATGMPAYSAFDKHEFDSVDLLNNNVLLNVPVFAKSGVFPINYSIFGNYGYTSQGSTDWIPLITGGYTGFQGVANGFIALYSGPNALSWTTVNCPGNGVTTKYSDYIVVTDGGTTHPLPSTVYADRTSAGTSCLSGSGFTAKTTDNSGFTLTISSNGSWSTLYDKSGTKLSSTQITDSNGNSMSAFPYGTGEAVNDTMGLSALSFGNLGLETWIDANGGTETMTTSYSRTSLQSNFGCTGIYEYGMTIPVFPTALSFPDRRPMTFTYEPTPGNPTSYTGRLSQLTLPEGGTVTYAYGPSTHNGIDCTYQTVPVLTRTLDNGDLTKYTLTHNLISGSSNYNAVNTVLDPGGNQTIYTFTGFSSTGTQASPVGQVLTQVQRYQGTSTLLTTDVYCYNYTTFSSCSFSAAPNATVALPISKVAIMHKLSGMSLTSATEADYDSYGNVIYSAQYDFGASTPTQATSTTYGTWNGSACVSIGNYINDRPCDVVTTAGGNTIAESRYAYDSKGNLLTRYVWSGSAWLSNATLNSYNANGTPSKLYDLANNETDYSYLAGSYSDGCSGATQYPFPTSIKNVGTGLTWNYTYDCTGGVTLTDADPNTNTIATFCYNTGTGCSGGAADPYWRVRQTSDPYGTTVNTNYYSNSFETSLLFNGANSLEQLWKDWDGYHRPVSVQTAQSPSGTNYDTVSTAYGWSTSPPNYRTVSTSQPCSALSAGTCTLVHGFYYDPIGRLASETTTSNESISTSFNQNDTLATLSPAPSGEHAKQVQTEFDGLGRLTYSCKVGNGSATACGGQNLNGLNGVTDAYAYSSPAAGQTEVSITRGSQTRYTIYDALGRVIQSHTPEGGTTYYYYDTVAAACSGGGVAHAGLLTCKVDANGTQTIYIYDSMNRLTDVGTNVSGSTCRRFRYDNNTVTGTTPTGITLANQYARMAEAETDDCTWPVTTAHQITDEWFSYDKDGRQTDLWESTPHSTQYYHSFATFYENGTVKTVQLASPSKYTMTWGLDGEGRWNSLTDTTTSQSIVTGATFYPAANPFQITLTGSTPDNDKYTVDNNTGNVTQYQFNLGSTPTTMTAALTWNPNGTLAKLAITDGFNSGGTQTCNFNPIAVPGTGYDDWGRLVGVDCGSGFWGQTLGYDQYDNLTKTAAGTGRIGSTWNPGYSPSTNHYSSPATYDADGNVTYDGVNTYSWNEYSKLKWSAAGTGTANCGTSGHCATYDAFGRIVEYSIGTAYRENWLTQAGMVNMQGATPQWAYWSAPEGGTAAVNANSGSYYYMHKDWLGSARLVSSVTAHTETMDQAFSPYGEAYAAFGSTATQYDMFAGTTANFDNGVMADTPNRELSVVGRWLSPDPAEAGWNQYAYVTNPNRETDSSGLKGNFCASFGFGCPNAGGDPASLFFDDSQVIEGYTIFDALSGQAGTYLYTNMYGQTGFGFSENLWSVTNNIIDAAAKGWNFVQTEGGIPIGTLHEQVFLSSTGWRTEIRDYGVYSNMSGLFADYASFSAFSRGLLAGNEELRKAVANGVRPELIGYVFQNDPGIQQLVPAMDQLMSLWGPLIMDRSETFTPFENVPPPNILIPPSPMPNIPMPPPQMPSPPSI